MFPAATPVILGVPASTVAVAVVVDADVAVTAAVSPVYVNVSFPVVARFFVTPTPI